MLLIRRRSNRNFFLRPLAAPSYPPGALGVCPSVCAPLAAKSQVPLQRLPRDNLETSRSSLSDSKFHYSDFLQTSCLELVADLSRVCRRRLEQVADKLETSRVRRKFVASLIRGSSCNGIKNPISSRHLDFVSRKSL